MMSSPLHRRALLQAGAAGLALAAAPRAARAATKPDVIVVGAGLSGLYAAQLLEAEGARVLVLEGRDRVGGRLLTLDDVPGRPEAGGNGIGAGYARVIDAAKQSGVGLIPVRQRTETTQGKSLINLQGANILPKDWPTSPLNPFPAALKSKLPWEYQWPFYAKANPLKADDSWLDPRFAAHDISIHEFMRRQGQSEETIELACGVGMLYGTNPYDYSVLALFHSLVWGAKQLEFGREAFAIAGGNQRLPEAMAKRLKAPVVTGKTLVGVTTTKSGAEVRCSDGSRYGAKAVVITTPFTALRSVRFDPVLTGLQQEAVSLLGYSTAFQVHFAVEKPYWTLDGLPADMWTDGPAGRLAALRYGDDPQAVTSVLAFVNGAQGERLDRMDQPAAAAEILAFLHRVRPATKGALRPLKAVSWQRDPFAGGIYSAFKPGQVTRYADVMAKPHGWVHFAGEHTATLNRGMEGAMESGERAAIEVLGRL